MEKHFPFALSRVAQLTWRGHFGTFERQAQVCELTISPQCDERLLSQ